MRPMFNWNLLGTLWKEAGNQNRAMVPVSQNISYKSVLGATLVKLAKADPKVVVLTADLRGSLGLEEYSTQFPDRFIEVGVAEQNMLGIAAGLALTGYKPYVCGFAAFSPGRNWDQLRVSVCYSNLDVTIVSSHAGLSVGQDGATHQALEDLALTLPLPNLKVFTPTDAEELGQIITVNHQMKGPAYLRFGREPLPQLAKTQPFVIGQTKIIKMGKTGVIFAHGVGVKNGLEAAKMLEVDGISLAVIAVPTLKPLTEQEIYSHLENKKFAFTLEDHQRVGGMGSVIAQIMAMKPVCPLFCLGVNDQFGASGSASVLYQKYHLDPKGVADTIKKTISELE